ncbi:MAG: OmpA family protein [Treponema sp.]|nr:OmpA family protein [Treponema sp.]
MKKHLFFLFIAFLLITGFLSAQSTAREIEALLETNAVTYSQAARFVLDAANVLNTSNAEEAFLYAAGQNWLPKRAAPGSIARLDEISLLILHSFDIKSGIMFGIFKTPHYAYRELVYKDIVYGLIDPAMTVTGERLLAYINRILTINEEAAAKAEARKLAAQQKADREAAARREARAAEISVILVEQEVADTKVEATTEGVVITLSDIQFLADSAVLAQSETAKLLEIANILKNIPNVKLLVAGHTAMAGSPEGQRRVSLERARTVADYLVSLGACKAENVTSAGYGADRPVASNVTPEGMAANRRVEITILEN